MRCANLILILFNDKSKRFMNMDSLEGAILGCTWSLEISEKLHLSFVEDITFGRLSSLLFPFFSYFSILFSVTSLNCATLTEAS